MRAATQPVAAFVLRLKIFGRRASTILIEETTMSVTAGLISQAPAPASGVAGRFGVYGGRYVPETLMAALEEL